MLYILLGGVAMLLATIKYNGVKIIFPSELSGEMDIFMSGDGLDGERTCVSDFSGQRLLSSEGYEDKVKQFVTSQGRFVEPDQQVEYWEQHRVYEDWGTVVLLRLSVNSVVIAQGIFFHQGIYSEAQTALAN
jgi:hypothetical protein